MEDGAEFTGKTVEDAIAEAEASLGATRDTLHVDVLSQGTRGVFGIGAEQARVRVRTLAPPSARPTQETRTVDVPAVQDTDSGPSTEEDSVDELMVEVDEPTAPSSQSSAELAEEATVVLSDLLHSMGFDVEVTVRSPEDPIMLGVTGQNLGVLIGRRGDNLSAIQFMVNLILSKNRRQWPRVVIDVENYRARREDSLRTLADRICYRVRRNGRPFTLEAMPASDRRIIHLALRDNPDVETYSIGEGPARRVVIAPKRRTAGGGDSQE